MRILGNWEIAKLGFWLLVFVWSFGFGAWNFAYAGTWPNFSNGGGGDWTTGYYRPISITNSTGAALVDYQVCITLTTAALGNPYTHIKADGSDIRFSTNPPPNSGAELSYWIESWNNAGNSTIWLKVPNLLAGDSYIYMYYGNISATAVSTGTGTFVFFDDFDGMTLDTTKWQAGAVGDITKYSVSNSILSATTTLAKYLDAKMTFNPIGYIVESKMNAPEVDNTCPLGWLGSNFYYRIQYYGGYGGAIWIVSGPEQYVARSTLYSGGYSIAGVQIVNATQVKYYKNYGLVYTYNFGTAIIPTNDVHPTLFHQNAATTSYWDWVRVRQYVSPEPTVAAPGSESPCYTGSLVAVAATTNWTSLIAPGQKVVMGQAIAQAKFDMVVSGTNTAHWKRFRVDKFCRAGHALIPDDKIEVQLWMENNGDGFFDAGDQMLAKGNFTNNTCYLNLTRRVIDATPHTYYIIYKFDANCGGGQFAGVNIGWNGYLEFDEGIAAGVPP